MLFNSFIFFIFLAVVLPVFYSLKGKTAKNSFLLVASYFFYGYWDWRFLSLLLISTVADFIIGRKLYATDKQSRRKLLLFASMAINLGILGFFKYFNFFVESFDLMLNGFGAKLDYLHLKIILPVGISFYTFQTMSYTIDIYRKKLKPTNNLLDFALFVSFFPQLVAGPIERAANLLPQLSKNYAPKREQIERGIVLIIMGLFKKVMIGDTAGRFVDNIFIAPDAYMSGELLAGLLLFSVQIYADFSGYSSIARGVAKLLGIELMKNFEQPYLATNITEFWRRWHISLSSWLKDYLYISLGGNRKGNRRTYVNLMLTMLLGGLWHGASWNFVIWGGIHGIYLAIHKMILGDRKPQTYYKYNGIGSFIGYVLKVILNYALVTFTWLFFRSSDWDTTKMFFHKMFNWESTTYSSQFLVITISFMLMMLVFDFFQYRHRKHTFILLIKNQGIRIGILLAMLISTFVFMMQSDPLPFVYFQF